MAKDHVAIILATYQGEDFLTAQLESFASQTHKNWSLWISDDGSSDGTLGVVTHFKKMHPKLKVSTLEGLQKGVAHNFLSSLFNRKIKADYYAFSDQDDVWHTEKLMRSLDKLKTVSSKRPALVGSRTFITDKDLTVKGKSPLFKRPPSFSNAIVQSLVGGNTMMLNNCAREAMLEIGYVPKVVAHDWWVYMFITGIGGDVFYQSEPSVYYRQHSDNIVGANTGMGAKFKRVISALGNRFSDWNSVNINTLNQCRGMLTAENVIILDQFIELRKKRYLRAVFVLNKTGIYRQTVQGNLSLNVAAFLGKI